MKNTLLYGSILLLAGLSSPRLEAQEISAPFENRITPSEREPTVLFDARLGAAPRPYKLFISPLVIRTDGAWLDQLVSGVILNLAGDKKLKIAGSFTHLDLDGSADRKKYGLATTYRFLKSGDRALSLTAKYSDGSQGVAQHSEAGLYGEWPLVDHLVASAAAKIARDRKAGGEKSAGIVNPGLIYNFSHSSLAVDYTFNNHVDGEDDYSIGYEYDPNDSLALIAGAGKNKTFSFNLFILF